MTALKHLGKPLIFAAIIAAFMVWGGKAPQRAAAACSGANAGPGTLTVQNDLTANVDVYFVNVACQEQKVDTIPGGQQTIQITEANYPGMGAFNGAVYRVRDSATQTLLNKAIIVGAAYDSTTPPVTDITVGAVALTAYITNSVPGMLCTLDNNGAVAGNVQITNNYFNKSIKVASVNADCTEGQPNTLSPGGGITMTRFQTSVVNVHDAVSNALIQQIVVDKNAANPLVATFNQPGQPTCSTVTQGAATLTVTNNLVVAVNVFLVSSAGGPNCPDQGGALATIQPNTQGMVTAFIGGVYSIRNAGNALLRQVAPVNPTLNVVLNPPPSGTMLADGGFRPNTNGFSFANYGGDAGFISLTSVEMRRAFGDAVCATTVQPDGTCTLTPNAQQWMNARNNDMSGGHCDGFASLSLLMYGGQSNPNTFGAATVPGLNITNNAPLQREIAYWWTTQLLIQPYLSLTPVDVVNRLQQSWNTGFEAFVLGIAKRAPPTEGHAITPYDIVDQGNTGPNGDHIAWIMVYDNNWPNDMTRYVTVDLTANTWQYYASTDPTQPGSLYEGDATTHTLQLETTSLRLLTPQSPPFIASKPPSSTNSPGDANTFAPFGPSFNEIWMDTTAAQNQAALVVTDPVGNQTGQIGSALVNHIPNAKVQQFTSADLWKDNPPPDYLVPNGQPYTVTLTGVAATPEPSFVTMMGPANYVGLDNIQLDQGNVDTLQVSANRNRLTYTTNQTETPDIVIGFAQGVADYELALRNVSISAGGTISVSNDQVCQLTVQVSGVSTPLTFDFEVTRITDNTEQTFDQTGLSAAPNQPTTVRYANCSDTPAVPQTIGVYRSGNNTFYLRNSNTTGIADLTAALTISGSGSQYLPVVGDWLGTGIDSIGLYNQTNGQFLLRNTNTPGSADEQFVLGQAGDQPLAGHWTTALTHDGVGVFRPSNGLLYLKNTLSTGYGDYTMVLGVPGDVGIAGDWIGQGFNSPGVYRPAQGKFFLSNQVTNGAVFADESLVFGLANNIPIAGDWTGIGVTTVGVFNNGQVAQRNTLITGYGDNSFMFGQAGDLPIAGHWSAGFVAGSTANPLVNAPPNVLMPPAPGTGSTAGPAATSQPAHGGGLGD
ncbi:MAG: hypothetical protein ACYDBJ_11350 [Aggregatilineales bacterium]